MDAKRKGSAKRTRTKPRPDDFGSDSSFVVHGSFFPSSQIAHHIVTIPCLQKLKHIAAFTHFIHSRAYLKVKILHTHRKRLAFHAQYRRQPCSFFKWRGLRGLWERENWIHPQSLLLICAWLFFSFRLRAMSAWTHHYWHNPTVDCPADLKRKTGIGKICLKVTQRNQGSETKSPICMVWKMCKNFKVSEDSSK